MKSLITTDLSEAARKQAYETRSFFHRISVTCSDQIRMIENCRGSRGLEKYKERLEEIQKLALSSWECLR